MAYQCCYCEQSIERSDKAAVHVLLSSLWDESKATQDLFAHSHCASERLFGALGLSVPTDAETFGPE